MMKFVDLDSGFIESFFACRCNSVYPSPSSGDIPQLGFEQAATFHSVQKRVQSSWSNAIAMMSEFLHHGETEDWLV